MPFCSPLILRVRLQEGDTALMMACLRSHRSIQSNQNHADKNGDWSLNWVSVREGEARIRAGAVHGGVVTCTQGAEA